MKSTFSSCQSMTIITSLSMLILQLMSLLSCVNAHGYLSSPRSRNFVAHQDGKWWSDTTNGIQYPVPEDCPHCLNFGGTLARCGISDGTRNYDTPFANDGAGGSSGERMPFTSQATFNEGDFIDIETIVTTYHRGHFVFKICPLKDQFEVATQECFDEHPLEYIQDLITTSATQDENYPTRAYLGGVNLKTTNIDPYSGYGAGDGYYHDTFLHRFRLPEGVSGEWILLQWHWLTANSCAHPGYVEYYEKNPELGEDIDFLKQVGDCPDYPPDGRGVPEQFWNCAEIRILPSNNDQSDSSNGNDNNGGDDNSREDASESSPTETAPNNSDESSSSSIGMIQQADRNNDGIISLAENFASFGAVQMSSSVAVLKPMKQALTVMLEPSDNVMVKRAQKSKNFQGSNVLKFDSMPSIYSLIRFDLSSLKGDFDSIKSATLKLYTLSDIGSEGGNFNPVAGDWNEEKVTWDNAPSQIGPQSTKIKMMSQVTSNSWYETDMTEGVLWSVLNKEQSFITIRINTRKKKHGSFASKEYKGGRYSPKLIVEIGDAAGLQSRPVPTKPNNNNKPSSNRPKPKPRPNKPSNNNSNISKPSKNKPQNPANKPQRPGNKPANKPQRPGNKPANKPQQPGNKPQKPAADPPAGALTPSDSSSSNFNKPSSPLSSASSTKKSFDILQKKASIIDNELFLYESPRGGWMPSSVYKYDGLAKGLKLMNSKGVAGMKYYLGDGSSKGHEYGLVNVAAFLAQSMKETIKYDACDENSWDLINGRYPLSNACGQLGQSYQDYHCSPEEKHMECPVDKNMKITAVTHAKWYGAPAPLFCGPKEGKNDFTGGWDYGFMCNVGWVDPPIVCDVYEGQSAGRFDHSEPVPNRNGRVDVEGCCWWGRGVIQTTGICNFGKLNYYLGKRAASEGRDAAYPTLDFCKDPEVICSSEEFQELKWIAGMFYWMESVQKYDVGGWNYMEKLHAYVDGGYSDPGFINAVSGIVNRGCHNPPCGTGAVDGGPERYSNFQKALIAFDLIEGPKKGKGEGGIGASSGGPVSACGSDWKGAEKCSTLCPSGTSLDCPDGEHCWAGIVCPASKDKKDLKGLK